MLILYFIILTILFLMSIKYKKNDFTNFYIITSIFFMGQRWGSGTDFWGYLRYYVTNFKREFIYTGLQNIVKENNLYFGLIILIVYATTIYLTIYFLKNICSDDKRKYNILIFFYFLSEIHFATLSQIRNWLAISFFINAYFFAKIKNKSFLPLLLFLLGLGFHKSIVFMIPIFFLKLEFLERKNLRIPLMISLLILPVVKISFLIEKLKIPYAHYIYSDFAKSLSHINLIKYYILYVFLCVYIVSNKTKIQDEIKSFIYKNFILYMIFYALSQQMGMILRISHYFKIFELLFLINIFKDIRIIGLKLFRPPNIVYAYIALYFIGLIYTGAYDVKNYEFRRMKLFREKSDQEYIEEIRGVGW